MIFGKSPNVIKAKYINKNGKEKESLLLYSGYWGISRHFHYIPEWLFALMICIPTYYVDPIQYFYFIYLLILLFDRAKRDDDRCSKKYGNYWQKYCLSVKYKIIPFIY